MNRIKKTFDKLKKEKKKAFIPYITAGDPSLKTTKDIVLTLAKSGADIIELGVPFSDPLADGPTIQKAIYRALKAGCTLKKVLSLVEELRKKIETPIVFMTYYNIVFNYGLKKFVSDAKTSGADGVIIPDLPIEEAEELLGYAKTKDFYIIQLAAPTTPSDRFRKIAKISNGFIYYVSLTGVTGMRKEIAHDLKKDLRKLKKLTSKPICVGFGISDKTQAKNVAGLSSGVIVGSAIIKIIEKYSSKKSLMLKKIGRFASGIASAIRN